MATRSAPPAVPRGPRLAQARGCSGSRQSPAAPPTAALALFSSARGALILLALVLLPPGAAAVFHRSARVGAVIGSGATTASGVMKSRVSYINTRFRTKINYNAIGSGAGRRQLIASAVLFAISDVPFTPQEDGSLAGAKKFTMPMALQTITLFTSLPGQPTLRLDAPTAAKIFQLQIRNWNNPAITRLNPGLKLPAKAIRVVVRKDVSGSTALFTRWLEVAATGVWRGGHGGTVMWASGVVKFALTSGVLLALDQYPNAITYAGTKPGLDAGFPEVLIKNRAGNYLLSSQADPTSSVPRTTPPALASWAAVSLVNRGGPNTWPIVSFMYVLARQNQFQNGAAGGVLKAWLRYLFSPRMQALLSNFDLTPCPASILKKNAAALNSMQLIAGTVVPIFR